ncbi:hypothetical protein IAR50_007339 [Cryptococcus sp. DSM 104548]
MPKAKQQVESESESEEEDEYEVDEILQHKKTGRGKLEYLVSWKGYDPTHNSWEPEANVSHAEELLRVYWDKQKKSGLKESEPPKKKRGRPSKESTRANSSRVSAPPAATDNDEPILKRPRTSGVNGRKRVVKDSSEEPDNEEEALSDEDEYKGDYETYMKMKDWDKVVKSVDTIDLNEEGQIVVLVTMEKGTKAAIPRDLAYERFHYKVLQFYEDHLKWSAKTDA